MVKDSFMRTAVVLVCAGAVAVSGYAIYSELTEPDNGVVTGRTYRPAYMTPGYYRSSCTTSDKGVSHCTQTWVAPVYYPECYEITYFNEEEDDSGDACVSPGDYEHRYEMGSNYP